MPLNPYVHTPTDVRLKLLVYGHPGVGKTTLASTLSQLGKVLFLNVEGGLLSVPPSEDILAVDMQGMTENFVAELPDIIDILYARDYEKHPWLEDVKTIVVDSGSELQSAVIESVVEEAIAKNPKRTDANEVWLEDYGKVSSALSTFFRRLKSLPFNVIITALVREQRTKEGNMLVDVKPDFTAKLAEKVMGYVDHVWYMYRTEEKQEDGETLLTPTILTQPVGVYQAKTRGHAFSDAIGNRILNPDLNTLYETLQKTQGI